MNDHIFVSYSSDDRAVAKRLVGELERQWNVYWDRKTPAGEEWSSFIERKIRSVKCVIVLWSPSSVGSFWVRSEAAEAAERGILIPVAIENGVDVPRLFKRFQLTALGAWGRGRSPRGLPGLLRRVEKKVGADPFPEWFTPLPNSAEISGDDLALVHRAWRKKKGVDEYRFDVVLYGHESVVERVAKVVYYLEGWGSDEYQTRRNKNGFMLKEVAWSPFLIRARVHIPGQAPVDLDRFINLTDESDPIEEFISRRA